MKRKTATALRKEAAELIRKAEEQELRENASIGRYVRDVAKEGFKQKYEEFQTTINNLIEGAKK